MEMTDETWHLVKDVPKVMGFIGGTSDRPAPITEKEADAILQRVQEGVEKPRRRCCSSRAKWFVLSMVRSTTSTVWSKKSITRRANCKVSVQIFGRSTPVELEFGQVEKRLKDF